MFGVRAVVDDPKPSLTQRGHLKAVGPGNLVLDRASVGTTISTPAPGSPHAMNLPITPNTQQAAILASRDQHNLIYGNAGSAKTTTLALKVMTALGRGMRPSAIQVLTYSQAAVQAFQERLSWMGTPREVIRQVRVHTFNELCQEQLAELEGNSGLLSVAEKMISLAQKQNPPALLR